MWTLIGLGIAACFLLAYLKGRKDGIEETERRLPTRDEHHKLQEEIERLQGIAMERWLAEKRRDNPDHPQRFT